MRKLENEIWNFLTLDCILDINGWSDKLSMNGIPRYVEYETLEIEYIQRWKSKKK